MEKKTTPARSRDILEAIRQRLAVGVITYDQARDYAEPHLANLNAELAQRARKASLSFRKVSFTGYMR
jgi:DNA-binding PucR family transcriptional regulator